MGLIATVVEGGAGAVLRDGLAVIGLLAVLAAAFFVALVCWGDRQYGVPRRERLGPIARRRTRRAIAELEFVDHPSQGGRR